MALTRKFLSALGIEADKVDEIISAHTETVDALKNERDTLRADAEKLPAVQKELDELKKADYEGKYNAEKQQHDALKASIASEKSKSAKEAALKAYFESKNIKDGNLKIAMRGVSLDSIELDGENIKDTKALDELVDGDFKSLISTKDSSGKGGEKKSKVVDSGAKSGQNDSGGNEKPDYSIGAALAEHYAKD